MRTSPTRENAQGFDSILSRLTLKKGIAGDYLVTRSREEYDRLLNAALVGDIPENLTLGRAGLRLDSRIIIPPDSVLCC